MGSYGIGVSRLVGAIIEAKYDEKEEIMKWPFSVAPYELAIIPMINKNDTSALDKANKLFKHFESKNIDTIIDDMDENLHQKLKINLIYVNAEKEFIKKLTNVSDPEKKRKINRKLIIKIFERYAKKIKNS